MNDKKAWKEMLGDPPGGGSGSGRELDLPVVDEALTRRTFLELIGFSIAAATFAGCRPSTEKVVPNLGQPVDSTPGTSLWYASICAGCSASCGILVKTRDGRPIKLEGNRDYPTSGGGLCAMAHGLLFGLYDSARLQSPLIGEKEATWEQADREIIAKLDAAGASGKKVCLLSLPVTSPTSKSLIDRFLGRFPNSAHLVHRPVSWSAIARAHGDASVPAYRFDAARLIVSFGADFLGTWISPVEFARGYAAGRDLRGGRVSMARHVQIESRMSLTGSNADTRYVVTPDQQSAALLLLAGIVSRALPDASAESLAAFDGATLPEALRSGIASVAEELLRHRGESLVVADSNDPDLQQVVTLVNHLLGNYGRTLEAGTPSFGQTGEDAAISGLLEEMRAGQIGALIVLNANPLYDHFQAAELASALEKVPLTISLSAKRDETTAQFDYHAPTHHFLEAWDDAEPRRGLFALAQPTIAPLFRTRAYQESLMRWMGDGRAYYDLLRERWQQELFSRQSRFSTFDVFWDRSLHDGIFAADPLPAAEYTFDATGLADAIGRLVARTAVAEEAEERLWLLLYPTVALRDGAHAGNPWLQELPDPVTKVTWDNYASISPAYATREHLEEGSIVTISDGTKTLELPLHIQPGMSERCVAVALGYGRPMGGPEGQRIGVNAYGFVRNEGGTHRYDMARVTLTPTGRFRELARTQVHDLTEGKPILNDLTFTEYLKHADERTGEKAGGLWPGYEYSEHKWGMVIDMNACTGCSACLLSCQAENNVPVVGREEVRRRREMHWIRIDRYYQGPMENPSTVYEPMLCHHCDNASCESVCPVLATVHSSDGLNMQAYNRCVGTRYCANNCPYKVRRFNWFEYPHEDPVANLALNPDVTVRTRGVMEKCSFCVQRIQEVRIRARNEGRPISDGEIEPACQQSCPTQAITFGDLIDPASRVNALKLDRRNFVLLEELNLRPPLSYLAKVRNLAGSNTRER